jgi:superfamily II DNA or RNA helicase
VQKTQGAIFAGHQVVYRDERWTVVRSEQFETTCLLTLRGIERANRDQRQYALTAFDVVAPVRDSSRLRRRSRHGVLATVVRAVAGALPWDECRTAADAKIDLHAWQLEPAQAAVRGATRILLADAVGLGKTIQAGLVITELRARGLAERVLILTPAAIREQWADELSSRFALRPVIFDHSSLAAASAQLPPDINPWSVEALIISSIDLVKRPDTRIALDGATFDILVVDEAHHLTPGSHRGAVIKDIAGRIPWIVLASATPHSGDGAAYEFLSSVGESAGAPLKVFRRTRPQEEPRRLRRSRILYVAPTVAESALFLEIEAYSRALAAQRAETAARLLASIIARRAASSATAVARTLARRIALLTEMDPRELQPLLPWEEGEEDEDDVADEVVGGRGLEDVGREVEWLRQLSVLAAAASAKPTKIHAIRRLFRRTCEPLLIFSEYRDVVVHVAEALVDLEGVATLHGAMSIRERRHAIAAFNSGAARVLVATDAAGEGLNLQMRCRLVVNMELPWMPLRLEQRIGRVDRLGQTRCVHAIHLVHRGSYEGTVIARLQRRRAASAALLEEAPAAPAETTASRARSLIANATRGGDPSDGAVYSPRPGGRRPAALIVVFALPLLDRAGGVLHTTLVTLRIRVTTRRITRSGLRAVLADRRLTTALDDGTALAVNDAQRRTACTGSALERRVSAIRRNLITHAPALQWQGSLFDRRDERGAHRRASCQALLQEQLLRFETLSGSLQRLRSGTPRLIAAWLSEL